MKYAMVDGQRQEASPGLLGRCQECDAVMTPKCGKVRVAHWAHPQGFFDHWWESETKWHRNWKECFPEEWQEIVHCASDGERHIADVKTAYGLVIEFQHSDISAEERRSREEFYGPMCWVVDGQRLKLDRRRFSEALRCGKPLSASPLILIAPVEKCTLLQKWTSSRARVFFDFGGPLLWASLPRRPCGFALLTPVPRKSFLEAMLKGGPIKFLKVIGTRRRSASRVTPSPPYAGMPRPPRFKQSLARERRARAWRRF